MPAWEEIRMWRRTVRRELHQKRQQLTEDDRSRAGSVTLAKLSSIKTLREAHTIGFYWSFKGEVDMRPLVKDLIQGGVVAGLPVIVEKNQPLEYWAWTPGMDLEVGVWDTRIPAVRKVVCPEILLIPLLGFDLSGYRLGYGGGYFDRTLSALKIKPISIGVGHECGRLDTIYPQSHDVPMDIVVTEERIIHLGQASLEDRKESDSPALYASSPCYMHEFE